MTGLLFLALAVFRMGWIAQFLSKAVITGFLAGAAIDVVIGELPKITGTRRRRRQRVAGAGLVARDARRRARDDACSSAAAALAVILGLRFAAPAVPGALVLVAGGLLASTAFDLGAHGVALVGDVPRGLPRPSFPTSTSSPTTSRRSASRRSPCC